MTDKPVAGGRIKAATTPTPYLLSAACTSPLTVTGSTATDIAGATVTFTTVNPNASILVIGVFDIQCVTSAAVFVTGICAVDGVAQTGQAISDQAVAGHRETVSQAWPVALATAGSHTIKLQGALAGASGSSTFNSTHTTITLTVYDW